MPNRDATESEDFLEKVRELRYGTVFFPQTKPCGGADS